MRKVVLAIVAAFSALLAVPAMAADGTLSTATPSYAWEGSGMNGFQEEGQLPVGLAAARCSPAYSCDNEHLEIKDGGTLTVEIKAGAGSNDLDVRLYKSDESGTAPGVQNPAGEPAPEPIAQDIRTEKDAKIVVKGLKPGFYVAQVASFNAQNGAYNGTATLAPAAPATAPPATTAPGTPPATTDPGPQQTSPTPAANKADEAKRKKALAKCNKKAKKIKNKAKRKKAQKACAKKYRKKS